MSTEHSDTKPEPRRTIGRPLLVAFVVGLVAGIAGTIIVPGLVRPVLGAREGEIFRGVVRDKQAETDRLILTVLTPQGTILATFTEQVAEIGLLIQEGDSLALEMQEYAPFVDDPMIGRVVATRPPRDTLQAADSAGTRTVRDTGTATPDSGTVRADTATTDLEY